MLTMPFQAVSFVGVAGYVHPTGQEQRRNPELLGAVDTGFQEEFHLGKSYMDIWTIYEHPSFVDDFPIKKGGFNIHIVSISRWISMLFRSCDTRLRGDPKWYEDAWSGYAWGWVCCTPRDANPKWFTGAEKA